MKTNAFIAEVQRSQRAAEKFFALSAILCVLCASAMNEFQSRFVRRGSREARWSN